MSEELLLSIKQAREKAGLTQKQVEATLDMRKLMMKDYETGRIKLPIEVAIKLACTYHITIDELVNTENQISTLVKLETLFEKNDLDVIFFDPVIRSFIETYSEKVFSASVYDILVTELNLSGKEEFQTELLKYLYSVIGIDGKIVSTELNFVNSISQLIGVKIQSNKYQEYFKNAHNPDHLSKVLKENLALRHFIVWVMFFLAQSDGEFSHDELSYIETVAERLKILKSNFLLIKNNFIKEVLA